MSLYPRRLSPGDWLLIHYRVRLFDDDAPEVQIRGTVRGALGLRVELPAISPRLLPRGRANRYCALRIDRRFRPGRYRVDSHAMLGAVRHLSRTRETDYFDVGDDTTDAAPEAHVFAADDELRVFAALLAVMSHRDLRTILDARELDEDVHDARCIAAWARGQAGAWAEHARDPLARKIIGVRPISTMERAAYRLLDIPHLLRAVEQRALVREARR